MSQSTAAFAAFSVNEPLGLAQVWEILGVDFSDADGNAKMDQYIKDNRSLCRSVNY